MDNFYRLAVGVDITPLMVSIKTKPELWNQNTLRTEHEGTVHGAVNDIWLRFNEIPDENSEGVIDDKECINYPAFHSLPEAQELIFGLMARVRGERIGRVIIAELPPGECIAPHIDMGAPAEYYDRYQIVLYGAPGCIFRAGHEQVTMKTGEIWWFDNKQEHEVVNNSAEERVTMIVDIRGSR